jgi:hypothetical protein
MSPRRQDADRRLGELILYIAQKSAGDRRFGDTKLNKLLYFADFVAYAALGEPVTGAVYQKLPHGPCPRRLIPVRDQLLADGAVDLVTEGVGWPRKRTVAKRQPDLRGFTGEQVALIDEVIEHFWHYNARDIEGASHRVSVGWQLANMNEDIPYETALATGKPPSEDELEVARARFGDLGLIEA